MDAKFLKNGTVGAEKLVTAFLNTLLRSDAVVAWLATQNANNQRLTNLGAPQAPTDAARLVDVQQMPYKEAVVASATANITLSGSNPSADGVVVPDGQRILAPFQTDATKRGVYIVGAGPWVRSPDLDAPADFKGAKIPVSKGNTLANHTFGITTDDVVVDSTPLLFIDLGEDTPPAFPTPLNKDMTALVTTADGQRATATALAKTPAKGSYIRVLVGQPNGGPKFAFGLGDGVKTKAFYLSADAGSTAKTLATAAQGDELFYNQTIGGAPLAVTDAIDLDFLVTG